MVLYSVFILALFLGSVLVPLHLAAGEFETERERHDPYNPGWEDTSVMQRLIMSEWFFIQSMKTRQRERALEEVRQAIKDSAQKVTDLRAKLDTVPLSEQRQHPLRFAWVEARTEYWDKIAEMRDIENGKSVIGKDT